MWTSKTEKNKTFIGFICSDARISCEKQPIVVLRIFDLVRKKMGEDVRIVEEGDACATLVG